MNAQIFWPTTRSFFFLTPDGKPDSPFNFSMFSVLLCGRGRCSLMMVIIVLVSSDASNYPRLLDLQGWQLPELWTHQTSALQTPTTRQTHRNSVSQSIHPSIHLEKVWGRLKSVNKHGSLTSHCRSLLDSFPPDSSITLWISSSSFSAFVTSSLESFRLQEEHKCADENKMLHTAAKLHQAREAPFAFSAYFCIDNLPGSNLTSLNLT